MTTYTNDLSVLRELMADPVCYLTMESIPEEPESSDSGSSSEEEWSEEETPLISDEEIKERNNQKEFILALIENKRKGPDDSNFKAPRPKKKSRK